MLDFNLNCLIYPVKIFSNNLLLQMQFSKHNTIYSYGYQLTFNLPKIITKIRET